MTLLTVGCLMSWIFNVERPLFGVDLNNIELFWRFTTKSNSSNRKVSNEIKWDLEFTLTQGQNRGSVFFRQILQSHRANWIQFRVFSVKSLTGDFLAIGLNEATSTFKVAFGNLPTSVTNINTTKLPWVDIRGFQSLEITVYCFSVLEKSTFSY